jgi:hypothetical protein
MSKPSWAGGLLLLAAVAVAAAGDRQPVYRTPQEVFDAAKKALQKEDWKTFCGTLTNDSRDMFAFPMVMLPVMMKGFAKFFPEEKRKEFLAKLKPLEEVLAKHGLTEEALNKMELAKPAGKGLDAMKEALGKLLAPVKDRCAFFADMMKAFQKMDDKKGKGGVILRDGELKDVKIEGDKAKGVFVRQEGGKEQRDPIQFARVDGSWRIDLPPDFGKGPKKGPPE